MAVFKLKDYIDFDTDHEILAISWQVALDIAFTKIIDESLNDPVNKLEWVSMLPVIGATDGSCYADLDKVYSRLKIHMRGATSPWFVMNVLNQNNQTIRYKELNNTITTYNTITDKIN